MPFSTADARAPDDPVTTHEVRLCARSVGEAYVGAVVELGTPFESIEASAVLLGHEVHLALHGALFGICHRRVSAEPV